MSKLPLVEQIIKYADKKNISFCTPGHKAGLGFLCTEEGRKLYDKFIEADITEVDGADNLHHPEGVIKEAQKLLSDFYGSEKSYFLVNGSTSGNLAMIFSCFNEGDKVIVERNCHRSIFNGILMRKLKPVYISNKIHDEYNAPLSIDEEQFSCILEDNKDAKGIIITYPNYYGVCMNLKFIIKCCKKYNMKVLVDSAHGAHFGVHEKLPESALKLGADMVVMSSHKTLPSLTQTAYLHVSNKVDVERADFYVSAFLSTSPSYMFMCSMDYARFYLEEHGKKAYEELIERTEFYRNKINELSSFYVLGKDTKQIYDIDLTRYVINVKVGYSGHKLKKYLNSAGIEAEMSDESNVVLIFSPFNGEEDFKRLYEALRKCPLEILKDNTARLMKSKIPAKSFEPYEVMERKKKLIELNNSEGFICAQSIVPYPPGIPVVMMGEVIDKDSLKVIEYYLQNNITVLGVENAKVWILEEQDKHNKLTDNSQ